MGALNLDIIQGTYLSLLANIAGLTSTGILIFYLDYPASWVGFGIMLMMSFAMYL